jgi:bacteriorhodopsin
MYLPSSLLSMEVLAPVKKKKKKKKKLQFLHHPSFILPFYHLFSYTTIQSNSEVSDPRAGV